MARKQNPSTRPNLLDAALGVIRTKGYAATSVDDICARASLSKGAFFHHFSSKEDLAVAAANYWSETTGALFADAAYHAPEDPLERVLAYVELRKQLIQGELPDFTCLVGTMTQEVYETNSVIRDACWASISGHADTLVPDIAAAMERYPVAGDFTAESLALHTQAVIQGAFIIAKASGDPQRAVESIDHLKRYISLLFKQPANTR
ncbi:TetR/AcrR family transcriptional regulator [Brucella intermedia]|uniref:TetR/AcrR family transcriptional regulator n=1 Tax=Brucella intermedia TaxID=94625 RepID=UPI0003979C8F|nr:TetR/AcrR family transcriptional regulator [Brucella intermedia]ERI16220.1 TetR family transcriptional regulator [Ochrobactrum sp. EGD-AQ16]MCO7739366.1 TetR/AcrR family transcriptional regulator [Brucella intermedia]WLF97414.1 TetR/AcrR family transcriptional regulator [Brucella intermedia]